VVQDAGAAAADGVEPQTVRPEVSLLRPVHPQRDRLSAHPPAAKGSVVADAAAPQPAALPGCADCEEQVHAR
jgi:hypothetical protein